MAGFSGIVVRGRRWGRPAWRISIVFERDRSFSPPFLRNFAAGQVRAKVEKTRMLEFCAARAIVPHSERQEGGIPFGFAQKKKPPLRNKKMSARRHLKFYLKVVRTAVTDLGISWIARAFASNLSNEWRIQGRCQAGGAIGGMKAACYSAPLRKRSRPCARGKCRRADI